MSKADVYFQELLIGVKLGLERKVSNSSTRSCVVPEISCNGWAHGTGQRSESEVRGERSWFGL